MPRILRWSLVAFAISFTGIRMSFGADVVGDLNRWLSDTGLTTYLVAVDAARDSDITAELPSAHEITSVDFADFATGVSSRMQYTTQFDFGEEWYKSHHSPHYIVLFNLLMDGRDFE